MPEFDSIDSALNYIDKCLNETLKADIAPVVERKLQENIEKDVYDSYTPTVYQRRHELDSSDNIVSEVISNGTLETRDIAEPSESLVGTIIDNSEGTILSEWINNGDVYPLFGDGYNYLNPAFFIEDTIKGLQDGNELSQVAITGLKKQGIEATPNLIIGL